MHLFFFNLHGLIRGTNLEIGKDADNGGQITYVMELAEELSNHPEISSIQLFTRLIDDPALSKDYSVAVETVNEKFTIRRVACGGKKYLAKELLWQHLDEYTSNALQHIQSNQLPCDWMHGHYADAGYVASELSSLLDIPFAFTSHSLGRIKQERMTDAGTDEKTMEGFHFEHRIPAEEKAILSSEFVVASTRQERDSYSVYDSFSQTDYEVIPPGTNLDRFSAYFSETIMGETPSSEEMRARVKIQTKLDKFLTQPDKPMILALCRPDKRKNIEGVVKAFGMDKELQAMANLTIFAGLRQDIRSMPDSEKEVLTELLLMMDAYDLYGKMAIPKKHEISWEVPEIYRIAARKNGVFINPAFVEPFGLTLLEAAASGLPVLATQNGGPSEILENLDNGHLIDPHDPEDIAKKIKKLISDREHWQNCSLNGMEHVQEHYSWKAHATKYLEKVKANLMLSGGEGFKGNWKMAQQFHRLRQAKRMLICDIDGTLVDPNCENLGLIDLKNWLAERSDSTVFGVATGRNPTLIREILQEYQIPEPDFAIHSVGSGILYRPNGEATTDKAWEQHIDHQWNRNRIFQLLEDLPGLTLQGANVQNPWKLSYDYEEEVFDLEEFRNRLGGHWYRASIIQSHGAYLDILPRRASKGKAIKYLAKKWHIPLSEIVTCGDSGNDLDMFTSTMHGVIVANHSTELNVCHQLPGVYFAEQVAADGILEGLEHFGWKEKKNVCC